MGSQCGEDAVWQWQGVSGEAGVTAAGGTGSSTFTCGR